jgi:hypothetical protein
MPVPSGSNFRMVRDPGVSESMGRCLLSEAFQDPEVRLTMERADGEALAVRREPQLQSLGHPVPGVRHTGSSVPPIVYQPCSVWGRVGSCRSAVCSTLCPRLRSPNLRYDIAK